MQGLFRSVPGRVRTCNLRLRRPTRYPVAPRRPIVPISHRASGSLIANEHYGRSVRRLQVRHRTDRDVRWRPMYFRCSGASGWRIRRRGTAFIDCMASQSPLWPDEPAGSPRCLSCEASDGNGELAAMLRDFSGMTSSRGIENRASAAYGDNSCQSGANLNDSRSTELGTQVHAPIV